MSFNIGDRVIIKKDAPYGITIEGTIGEIVDHDNGYFLEPYKGSSYFKILQYSPHYHDKYAELDVVFPIRNEDIELLEETNEGGLGLLLKGDPVDDETT